jgi:hypothetical protein
MAKASEYEVHCPRCRVTFPVGTKRCVHCGGRTGQRVESEGRPVWDDRSGRFRVVTAGGSDVESTQRPLAFDAEPEEDEADQTGRGGILRVAVTVVWILLAVAFSILRACQER